MKTIFAAILLALAVMAVLLSAQSSWAGQSITYTCTQLPGGAIDCDANKTPLPTTPDDADCDCCGPTLTDKVAELRLLGFRAVATALLCTDPDVQQAALDAGYTCGDLVGIAERQGRRK